MNQLLQNPAAGTPLYDSATLVTPAINWARGQLAVETECCRILGTITLTVSQRNYNFSAINTGVSNGIAGVMNVREALYGVASGYKWMRARPWPWFWMLKLNNPVPPSGPPTVWSQFGQGSAGAGTITGVGSGTLSSGSFYIDPIPDLAYSLLLDCSCYPSALTSDSDFEAIPYTFTDAVPFLAAYWVLLTAQTGQRQADAMRMMDQYKEFVSRANQASAPNVNRYLYERQSDPSTINKLGVQKATGG